MKGKIRGKTVLIAGILLGLIVVCVWLVLRKPKPDNADSIKEDTKFLTESYPTKMLVYGERFPVLPEGVKVEYVDHISPALTEITGTEYKYVMLVINDLSGKVHFSDEDCETIRRILNQKHVFFSYIGESNLTEFARLGFHQYDCPMNEDGNRSFTWFDGSELMGVYSAGYDDVRGGGLSDGTLFEGIESAMVHMLEDHVPEIRAEIR